MHPTPTAISKEELRAVLERTVPLPTPASTTGGGSDDDFVQPPFNSQQQHQEQQQPQDGDASASASAVVTEPGKLWKNVPMATRAMVYEYMKAQMGEGNLKTIKGQQAVSDAVNLFPPGSIDVASVKAIYSKERCKDHTIEKASGGGGGGGGIGQQQQQQLPTAATLGVAFGSTPLLPHSPSSSSLLHTVANTPMTIATSPGSISEGGTIIPRATAATAATAAITAITAITATQQQQRPSSLAAIAAAAGISEAMKASSTAAAVVPPTTTTQATTTQAAATTVSPPTEGELLAAGLKHGADEATLRSILSTAASSGMYLRVVLSLLARAGPEGLGVAEMAQLAVTLGMKDWDPSAPAVKNGVSRYTKNEAVAALPHFKYALKCFPGVVDIRPKRSGSSGSGGGGGGKHHDEHDEMHE